MTEEEKVALWMPKGAPAAAAALKHSSAAAASNKAPSLNGSDGYAGFLTREGLAMPLYCDVGSIS